MDCELFEGVSGVDDLLLIQKMMRLDGVLTTCYDEPEGGLEECIGHHW